MAMEAKRAAKLEKKLKTLLGGYQVSIGLDFDQWDMNRCLSLGSGSSIDQSVERCL